MSVECPECGEFFKQVGYHWGNSSCSKPKLTNRQKEICIGLLMGDAWIGKKGRLRVEMTNKEFIEWIQRELGIIVSNITLKNSASESAQKNREYGYKVNESNYSDCWILSTRTLDYFSELRNWYSSGNKRFPKDLDISPLIIKIWYCCDGSFVDSRYPVIYSANESDKKDKIVKMFENYDLSPSFTKGAGGTIQFKTSESDDFFKYIGKPLPGFEYKWPERFK